MIENNLIKQELIQNPWVQCPNLECVNSLLKDFTVKNYYRGSGLPSERLSELELKYRNWIKQIIDLQDFDYCYFVNGVTDAINQWLLNEDRDWQYLVGDYEYAHAVTGKGKKVQNIQKDLPLYISNPCCATGDFIKISQYDCPIILDCAYLGSTAIQKIDIPVNTEQIFFSFSKGWGLIGQRLGLVFSKYKIPSLHIMKNVECWNFNSVELCHLILDNFDPDTTYYMNRQKQINICESWNFEPSDCFFMAKSYDREYKPRRRVPNIARIDLSRFFNEEITA